MSTNGLEIVAREVAAVFTPIRQLDTPNRVTGLFADLGYELPGAALFSELPTLVRTAGDLIPAVEALAAADTDEATMAALARLLEAIARVAVAVNDVLPDINAAVAAIPGFIANSEIDQLPERLVDYLLTEYLARAHRRIYGTLLFVGVLDLIQRPADATKFQPAFTLRKVWWDRLPLVVSAPQTLPETVYQWETGFQSQRFVERLYVLFNAFLLPGGLYPQSTRARTALDNTTPDLRELRMPIFQRNVWPATRGEFGISVSPVEAQGSEAAGFAVLPYIDGATEFDFDVSERFEIIFEASGSIEAGIGVVLRPSGIRFVDNLFSTPASAVDAGISLEARQREGSDEIILFGAPGATRLAIQGPHGTVFVSKAEDIDAGFELGFEALRLVVKGGEGDGFLKVILGDGGITAEVGLGLRVSRREGVTFTGSGGLEIRLPAHIELGPLEVLGLLIALKLRGGDFVLEAGADFKLELGPLTGVVENMGVSATLSFPPGGGNLGPANLGFGFKPPNGVGLAVDAGPVKGGGYLFFDFDKQEYAGALELSISGWLSLKAIALINTKLPGGRPGFSLLVIITAEFSPGLQLGYGFMLIGVGGLLGLNRTMLLDPLVQGVRSGAVNRILFPTNVVANAPQILSDMRTIFPPQEGVFLIGPMAKIGWASLITVSLGVIIEIPGNVAILGRLRLALPTDDANAVVVLQLTFIGALEFDKRRLWFSASLYESRVLFITLDGEMGLLMDFSDNPDFVLSVGGFHPRFTPPPLPFPTPTRLALSLVNESFARVRAELYLALTTNSVQMGCRAEAFFGFGACSVEGHLSFDALLRFSPLYLLVEISVGFSVRVFGVGLFNVHLRASLEGPTPWHIQGSAEISILFFSFDVDVDVTFGERRAETLPPVEVLPKLRSELAKAESWKTTLPASRRLFVSLRELGETDALVLHPIGTLEISQRFAPLNLTLDKIGNQRPSDLRRAAVSVTGGDLAVRGAMREKFAIGQYRDLPDAEKLSAPAYEPLDSGVRLGAAGQPWATGPLAQRTVRYETVVIDTAFRRRRAPFFVFWPGLFDHFRLGAAVSQSVVSLAAERRLQPFAERIEVGDDAFVLAHQTDNTPYAATAGFASYAEAADHLAGAVRGDPSLAGAIHVIPAAEAMAIA